MEIIRNEMNRVFIVSNENQIIRNQNLYSLKEE